MLLGASELLGNGVTTTCEQYRHPSAVVDAVLDAGIRAVYTPAIFDVPDAGPGSSWQALLAGACAGAAAPAGKDATAPRPARPPPAPTRPPQRAPPIAPPPP